MKFERKQLVAGKPVQNEIEFSSLEYAKDHVEMMFRHTSGCFSFEEKRFANGQTSFTLKDKGNKIIYQVKTTK
jgi:hypothetical protein